MATLRKIIALTLSAVLILGATSSADSAEYRSTYCGREFTRAVMEICARQVKRTAPLWQRIYTASRGKIEIIPKCIKTLRLIGSVMFGATLNPVYKCCSAVNFGTLKDDNSL